jgi:5'-nucleotidase (lipoprotein e(P4) family)
MRHWLAFSLTLLCGTIFSSCALACPCNEITIPDDPHFDIKKGLEFSESELYSQELEKAVAAAKTACEANMSLPNRAIVVDLDETVLDNRELIRTAEVPANPTYLKTWIDAAWTKWVNEANIPAIKPTAEFVRWAKSKGFLVFAITARESNERDGTELNLKRQNIPYDGLFLKPLGSTERSEDFKTSYRRMLEQQGYTIVCNMGDQQSDLYGLHSIDCEKLPNRMYFTK